MSPRGKLNAEFPCPSKIDVSCMGVGSRRSSGDLGASTSRGCASWEEELEGRRGLRSGGGVAPMREL